MAQALRLSSRAEASKRSLLSEHALQRVTGVAMYKQASVYWLVPFAALTLTGCEAVKGIFKAGFWVGAIVVVALVVAVAYVLNRLRT
jgi:hypothetical protein